MKEGREVGRMDVKEEGQRCAKVCGDADKLLTGERKEGIHAACALIDVTRKQEKEILRVLVSRIPRKIAIETFTPRPP